MVAQGLDAARDGAHLLLTTLRTNCGGTAEEEESVSFDFHCFRFLVISQLQNVTILARTT